MFSIINVVLIILINTLRSANCKINFLREFISWRPLDYWRAIPLFSDCGSGSRHSYLYWKLFFFFNLGSSTSKIISKPNLSLFHHFLDKNDNYLYFPISFTFKKIAGTSKRNSNETIFRLIYINYWRFIFISIHMFLYLKGEW